MYGIMLLFRNQYLKTEVIIHTFFKQSKKHTHQQTMIVVCEIVMLKKVMLKKVMLKIVMLKKLYLGI